MPPRSRPGEDRPAIFHPGRSNDFHREDFRYRRHLQSARRPAKGAGRAFRPAATAFGGDRRRRRFRAENRRGHFTSVSKRRLSRPPCLAGGPRVSGRANSKSGRRRRLGGLPGLPGWRLHSRRLVCVRSRRSRASGNLLSGNPGPGGATASGRFRGERRAPGGEPGSPVAVGRIGEPPPSSSVFRFSSPALPTAFRHSVLQFGNVSKRPGDGQRVQRGVRGVGKGGFRIGGSAVPFRPLASRASVPGRMLSFVASRKPTGSPVNQRPASAGSHRLRSVRLRSRTVSKQIFKKNMNKFNSLKF